VKIAPKKQLEHFSKIAKVPKGWFEFCNDCRPK
jgi:hypothetical protein